MAIDWVLMTHPERGEQKQPAHMSKILRAQGWEAVEVPKTRTKKAVEDEPQDEENG